MDENVNEKATDQVIQDLIAEKVRLTAENEYLQAALKEKKERESGGSGNFVRACQQNKITRG